MKKKTTPSNLKSEILSCAEHLFKKHGYDKTTFQMIADDLGITKGAITYHFKFKWGLFDELFSNYLVDLHTFVGTNLRENYNCYLHYCVVYICFFRDAMKNQQNWNFFYKNEIRTFLEREKINLFNTMFERISTAFHKDFSIEEITVASIMASGAVVRLLAEYDQNPNFMPKDRYFHHIIKTIGMYAGLDTTTIEKNIARAFAFVDTSTPPTFCLFQ